MSLACSRSWKRALRQSAALLVIFMSLLVGQAAPSPTTPAALRQMIVDSSDLVHGSWGLFVDGDVAASVASLDEALLLAAQSAEALADPALAEELGPAVRKLRTRLRQYSSAILSAERYVEGGRATAKVLLKRVESAWRFGEKAAAVLGKPMLSMVWPRGSAGFLHAGDDADFKFALPPGCPGPASVVLQNAGPSQAVDTSSLVVTPDGHISFRMGAASGAGRVTITACDKEQHFLVYNKGQDINRGPPGGEDLRPGLYAMEFSINGSPFEPYGTVRLRPGEIRAVARQLIRAAEEVRGLIGLPSNCTYSYGWTPVVDESFSLTLVIRCVLDEVTVSVPAVIRVRRM